MQADREARRDDEGPPGGPSAEQALAALGQRLEALSADSDVPPLPRAERLALVEGDLLAFTAQQTRRDADFGGDRGHPALALVSSWRDQLATQHIGDVAAEAERLVDDLLADEAERWSAVADDAAGAHNASSCFERLIDATLLDRDAITRRRDPHAELPVGPRRQALREAFLAAVAAEEPDAQVRHRWALQLLDGADVVLTSLEEVAPERAALHLDLVIDDLDWYLRHVAASPATKRRLRRKLWRLRSERQERDLQGRLEARFGAVFVRRFDKLVVWLIFFVLAALFVESVFPLPVTVRVWLMVADAMACVVFLTEFFVKLWMVRGHSRWFVRHFVIDFLPSIPVGLLMLLTGTLTVGHLRGDKSRSLRVIRLMRVFRLTRIARAFTFLARGFDRLARRYGHLLNHDIVLYPNREERALARRERTSLSSATWRLRARAGEEWRKLLQGAPPEQRPGVARARLRMLAEARAAGHTHRAARTSGRPVASVRDIPAETMLRRLDAVTAEELEADLGQDFVARCARAVRLFSRWPLRWLPLVRKALPRWGPAMSDAAVTAASAHRIAAELRRHHGRWFWIADLHGTVTPSEFVDRVGSAMVRSSFRPAYRLTLFGTAYLVVRLLIDATGLPEPGWLQGLEDLVGKTLLVLGSVCFVILGLGWWMRRLAGQATSFYEQTALAQFLALTEAIKGRFLARDAAILDRRVFAPEELVHDDALEGGSVVRQATFVDAVRSWLIRARAGKDLGAMPDAMQRAVLLYRDNLDGALFGESDVRTTSQLLGNPALRQLRSLSMRVNRREAKALRALDLSRPRSSIRGPYLWFSFISKAISQSAARLIVEYNRHAIPLKELPYASLPERRRYEAWLRTGKPAQGAELRANLQEQRRGYITTAFTALHFLDDDPARDREVAERFGAEVLRNLKQDRKTLFREVFGTQPLHTRPKEQRVLNLYRLYERWVGGGRAFLIPLRILWRWLGLGWRFVRWLVRAIGEVRQPRMRGAHGIAESADYATALRKVGRMRGPVVWASLWLRARFDAEYLGVRVPGSDRTGLEDAAWVSDLEFLGATPSEVRQIQGERARAEADVRRLARLLGGGLRRAVAERIGVPAEALGREHLRAATAAYRADFEGVRSLLSCQEILRERAAGALLQPPLPRPWRPRPGLRRVFKRWCRSYGTPATRPGRRAFWRAVVHDANGVGRALGAWARHGADEARRLGTDKLAELLRHPGRISEQVVTLRTVQSLALIDLLNYREHVYRLGDYAAAGDDPGDALTLMRGEDRGPATVAPAG